MFYLNEKSMLTHKLCTGLFAILMVLPFTSHADETETDETRADKVFEYFDKDGDGVLNESEKATAKRAHNVIDYNNDGKSTAVNLVEPDVYTMLQTTMTMVKLVHVKRTGRSATITL